MVRRASRYLSSQGGNGFTHRPDLDVAYPSSYYKEATEADDATPIRSVPPIRSKWIST